MSHLHRWADSSQPVSVKFITGNGGVGKSRLAGEFASALQAKGWAAGFVDLRKSQSFFLNEQGTLLVIDYPEENREGVSELFRDLATIGEDGRLRILFLTRQSAESWLQIAHDNHASDFVEMAPVVLGGLKAAPGHGLYTSALERAAEAFGTVPLPLSEEALADWLSQAPENDRALFILAAAVHGARNPDDSAVRYSGSEVIQALVKREIDRLRAIAASIDVPDRHSLARVLALAAIADELSVQYITSLAGDSRLALGLDTGRSIRVDMEATGLFCDQVARAPKPDIVAAAFVIEILGQRPDTAPEIVWAGIQTDVEGGLERLGRLSYDAEAVLGILQPRLSTWLAAALRDDVARCFALAEFLSSTRLPLGLLGAAIEVWTTLLKQTSDDPERAHLLNNLSADLSDAGDPGGRWRRFARRWRYAAVCQRRIQLVMSPTWR